MFQVGRVCVKIAGRDARLRCVVVEILDNTFVLVDGETRRKKCNMKHLEPLDKVVKIRKGATHEEVISALKDEGIAVAEKKQNKEKSLANKEGKKARPSKETAEKPKKAKKETAVKAEKIEISEEKIDKPKKKTAKKE